MTKELKQSFIKLNDLRIEILKEVEAHLLELNAVGVDVHEDLAHLTSVITSLRMQNDDVLKEGTSNE